MAGSAQPLTRECRPRKRALRYEDDEPVFTFDGPSEVPEKIVGCDHRVYIVKMALWHYLCDAYPKNEAAEALIRDMAALYERMNEKFLAFKEVKGLTVTDCRHIKKALTYFKAEYARGREQDEIDTEEVLSAISKCVMV